MENDRNVARAPEHHAADQDGVADEKCEEEGRQRDDRFLHAAQVEQDERADRHEFDQQLDRQHAQQHRMTKSASIPANPRPKGGARSPAAKPERTSWKTTGMSPARPSTTPPIRMAWQTRNVRKRGASAMTDSFTPRKLSRMSAA